MFNNMFINEFIKIQERNIENTLITMLMVMCYFGRKFDTYTITQQEITLQQRNIYIISLLPIKKRAQLWNRTPSWNKQECLYTGN